MMALVGAGKDLLNIEYRTWNNECRKGRRGQMRTRIASLTTAILLIIAAQGQSCLAAEPPAGRILQQSTTISPALATSVPAAMAGLKEKTIHLVDVRLPGEYEKYRIHGSLNIALHAIKTKPFLKTKPVVLVNEGFSLSQMTATCDELHQAGFKAAILAGGLLAWKEKGGQLIGDPFAMQHLNDITPQILFQETGCAHHLIIDAAGVKKRSGDIEVADAKTVPLMDNPTGQARLKALLKEKSADPFLSVLISADSGRENDRIRRQLEQAGIRRVFFLQDGWSAYEQYVKDRHPSGRTQIEHIAAPGVCRSCP
ncbi:MAG: rhodanese-like domain-containing protein [Desulfobacteraceae bacterium]|nr:MAG: rhodanese-like domain-containing protein [Desulfobacteraceae bacterium]